MGACKVSARYLKMAALEKESPTKVFTGEVLWVNRKPASVGWNRH
jgi:hypothetical protein